MLAIPTLPEASHHSAPMRHEQGVQREHASQLCRKGLPRIQVGWPTIQQVAAARSWDEICEAPEMLQASHWSRTSTSLSLRAAASNSVRPASQPANCPCISIQTKSNEYSGSSIRGSRISGSQCHPVARVQTLLDNLNSCCSVGVVGLSQLDLGGCKWVATAAAAAAPPPLHLLGGSILAQIEQKAPMGEQMQLKHNWRPDKRAHQSVAS